LDAAVFDAVLEDDLQQSEDEAHVQLVGEFLEVFDDR
tara:strand:+ start:693 stop:803 length:111 start_codon:yes stop_codon:yes gene_type:complete